MILPVLNVSNENGKIQKSTRKENTRKEASILTKKIGKKDCFIKNSDVSFGTTTGLRLSYTWENSIRNMEKSKMYFEGNTPTEAFSSLFSAISKDLNEAKEFEKIEQAQIDEKNKNQTPLEKYLSIIIMGKEAPSIITQTELPFSLDKFMKISERFIKDFGFNPSFNDRSAAIENFIVNKLGYKAPAGFFEQFSSEFKPYKEAKEILNTACKLMENKMIRLKK